MIEAGLAARLSGFVGLSALIADRVFPLVIPQQGAAQRMPCVVYQLVSRDRAMRFCATDEMVQAQYQIDAYARSYLDCKTVAVQVIAALLDFRGAMGDQSVHQVSLDSEIDVMDPEPGLYRVSMTFSIWHRPV